MWHVFLLHTGYTSIVGMIVYEAHFCVSVVRFHFAVSLSQFSAAGVIALPIVKKGTMTKLYSLAKRICRSNIPVLITGETGVGKEVAARYIHDESGSERGGEFAMTESDFAEFVREWEELGGEITDNLIRNGKSPTMLAFHQFLKWIHSRVGRKPGCGVGSVPCVQPDGNIYLCQGFVGCDEGRVGTVDTGLDHAKVEQFGEMYSDFLAKCDACWARNCCGIACIAQSIQLDRLGDAYEASQNCGIAKKMIEGIIYMYSRLVEERAEILNSLSMK